MTEPMTRTSDDIDGMKAIFPLTVERMGLSCWSGLWDRGLLSRNPATFPGILREQVEAIGLPEYLVDLSRLEWAAFVVRETPVERPSEDGRILLNPSIQLLRTPWGQILSIFLGEEEPYDLHAECGEEQILLWKHPVTGVVKAKRATSEDLLVLKMAAEEIDPKVVAAMGLIPVAALQDALDRAIEEGLLIRPPSRIRRPEAWSSGAYVRDEAFLKSDSFTLQWHVTQSCDLHCKHCYDRSDRESMSLGEAYGILEDLDRFCGSRNVRGHISFTGGNPLLYPEFIPLYRRAWEYGFGLSILGNPASRQQIEELIAIRKPDYFQVSLEGLRDANDLVRGPGHFDRTLHFLDILRDLGVYSMVMLTLTQENIDQVVALAEILRDRTDVFYFNRLSPVGEGASLALPSRERFVAFLDEYLVAARTNPILGMKESLINTCLYRRGGSLFGGCTGYGCGAAFNFVALLPDGEVHACRKFSSPIGNLKEQSLDHVYCSEAAEEYRERPAGCKNCPLSHVCGGCLAVVHGLVLDKRFDHDPHCFFEDSEAGAAATEGTPTSR
jgi:selenobiotic family peptide radical SAM maturase